MQLFAKRMLLIKLYICYLSGVFASIAPVSGAPLLGFGDLPSSPTSLIDFHGTNDDTIPYDLEHSAGIHFIHSNMFKL